MLRKISLLLSLSFLLACVSIPNMPPLLISEATAEPTASLPTTPPLPAASPTLVRQPSSPPVLPGASPTRVGSVAQTNLPSKPTLYPTYTAIPQSNWQNPGVPPSPFRPGASAVDLTPRPDAHTFQYRAHQREINVVIAQDGALTPSQERERADFCFEAWTRTWEIFGGYAYPTYTCAMANRYFPNDCARSAKGGAFSSTYATCKLSYRDWREVIQHEVFHAWNPGHLRDETKTWAMEGITTYYGNLLVDPNQTLIWIRTEGQANFLATPTRVANAKPSTPLTPTGSCNLNRPLASMGRGCDELAVYFKGAMVTYMLDVEISERTNRAKSFDNVLRRLYLQSIPETERILRSRSTPTRVGSTPSAPETPIEQILLSTITAEAGSPEFFTAFFKDYIEGMRDIREWHDGLFTKPSNLYIPPHPLVK